MVGSISDSNRHLRLHSPLGSNLVIQHMTGTEELGRLYAYQFELLCTDHDLDYDKIVGQRITAELDIPDGVRFFDGFVTDIRLLSIDDIGSRYEVTVRPWLWFLTRTSDCRIFQETTVPDIVQEVFGENGMPDVELRLEGEYRTWEYCVQYRETDFNFVCRLLEQEGIYFYFTHEKGKHTLVLIDDISMHEEFPGHSDTFFYGYGSAAPEDLQDYLEHLSVSKSIQPGKFAVTDFDFKKPRVGLLTKSEKERSHAYELGDPEIFDYPGEYKEYGDGEQYIERRMQETQSQHERIHGGGPNRGLVPGYKVKLDNHPHPSQNREYLVVSATYSFSNGSFVSDAQGENQYHCNVELISAEEVFRSARITPKPIVQGCQTAMIVGPAGEEIYCDEYGRVKVQFHWDRYGEENENSSCWMRVSQAWAGKEWGSMHIPRIGQEVVVSFLEGDPDQPLITGRVFNDDSMPNWALPGSKTQSGIVSRSTPGGGPSNFNALRMEDAKGSEELYIQAEKDENILVKNNKGETVGNNETISIGNDRTENVGHDETRTVGNDETVSIMNCRTDTVAVDETRAVGNNRTRNVANNETVNVGMMRTHTVGINEAITIGAAQEITIGAIQVINVGAAQMTEVGASRSISVGGGQSEEIGSALNTSVGADWSVEVGSDHAFKAGKKINIEAGDEIAFKCGGASIVMKKNGNITIKGKDVIIKAKSKIDAKASGTVKIKGASVKDN